MASTNFPPFKPQPIAGTQTSDRYGNVISTRPAPAPYEPPKSENQAPTSDRYGHVIDPGSSFEHAPTSSSLPPVAAQPAPGTQTSDRYGNVIGTRPAPAPYVPPKSDAPTSDRSGHVISPGVSSLPPVVAQAAPGTQTSDRYGNVISTRPAPAPYTPPASNPQAPTSDRWGNVISDTTVEWK